MSSKKYVTKTLEWQTKNIMEKNMMRNIDHQLQRTNHMEYHIESTKTECRRWPSLGAAIQTRSQQYNSIFKVQMPKITPYICRHTYCSNQAKAGMNPKTLQYLMGHSDISVTLNRYTHLGFEDASAEIERITKETET